MIVYNIIYGIYTKLDTKSFTNYLYLFFHLLIYLSILLSIYLINLSINTPIYIYILSISIYLEYIYFSPNILNAPDDSTVQCCCGDISCPFCNLLINLELTCPSSSAFWDIMMWFWYMFFGLLLLNFLYSHKFRCLFGLNAYFSEFWHKKLNQIWYIK